MTAMKSLVLLIVVFILLSNFSTVLNAQYFQDNTHLKYLTVFASDQPTLKHQLAKRQTNDETTPTPEDEAICNAQLSDVFCMVGITQGTIEALLSCNGVYRSIELAQNEANACAKGEGGQFCGSLWELYRIRASYIQWNCSKVLSLNTCPPNCRSLLEDFRNTLGCCINSYVNITGQYLGGSSLDYHIWNLCSVSLPPAACGNGPTISPPDNVQNCTNEDFFNKYYAENLCLPEKRQPYSDVLKRLGARFCGSVPPNYFEDLCSVDTNGIPCGLLYAQSSVDLSSLDLTYRSSYVSCTSNCRDGIATAKNRYGCCLGSLWFNISGEISALNPSVLKSCDIELPEACEGVIGSAMSIMKENDMLLIIGGVILCLQLIVIA